MDVLDARLHVSWVRVTSIQHKDVIVTDLLLVFHDTVTHRKMKRSFPGASTRDLRSVKRIVVSSVDDAHSEKKHLEFEVAIIIAEFRQAEVAAEQQDSANELQVAYEAHDIELRVAYEAHDVELQVAYEAHDIELRTANTAHADELRVAYEAHDIELRTANESHADELRTANAAHAKQLAEAKTSNIEEIAAYETFFKTLLFEAYGTIEEQTGQIAALNVVHEATIAAALRQQKHMETKEAELEVVKNDAINELAGIQNKQSSSSM
jgi:hypothetical protein